MTRDESTEGWLPLAGGGLANVSIRKRARLPPDVGGHEYIIYGQRISSGKEVSDRRKLIKTLNRSNIKYLAYETLNISTAFRFKAVDTLQAC